VRHEDDFEPEDIYGNANCMFLNCFKLSVVVVGILEFMLLLVVIHIVAEKDRRLYSKDIVV